MSIEELSPEHQVVAERARHYIASCIAGLAIATHVETPDLNFRLDQTNNSIREDI